SGRMRSGSLWKVFKVVVPYDRPGMFQAQSHARHPRVAIGVGEINVPGDKNILIIRAACRQDQYAENGDLDDPQECANHRTIPNPRAKMRNPKFQRLSGALTVAHGDVPCFTVRSTGL